MSNPNKPFHWPPQEPSYNLPKPPKKPKLSSTTKWVLGCSGAFVVGCALFFGGIYAIVWILRTAGH